MRDMTNKRRKDGELSVLMYESDKPHSIVSKAVPLDVAQTAQRSIAMSVAEGKTSDYSSRACSSEATGADKSEPDMQDNTTLTEVLCWLRCKSVEQPWRATTSTLRFYLALANGT